jgi:hypothetical protein
MTEERKARFDRGGARGKGNTIVFAAIKVNSLTGNYVLVGRKIILFGRYVCDLYVGIVQ